jgi:hypothetical protein
MVEIKTLWSYKAKLIKSQKGAIPPLFSFEFLCELRAGTAVGRSTSGPVVTIATFDPAVDIVVTCMFAPAMD